MNQDQLLVGEESDGTTRDYRSLAYARNEKRDMPKLCRPIPQGELLFNRELAKPNENQIMGVVWDIISEDEKYHEIVKKEGEELFILNEEKKRNSPFHCTRRFNQTD